VAGKVLERDEAISGFRTFRNTVSIMMEGTWPRQISGVQVLTPRSSPNTGIGATKTCFGSFPDERREDQEWRPEEPGWEVLSPLK
jgi:hypothetical protein